MYQVKYLSQEAASVPPVYGGGYGRKFQDMKLY
jgi:hypothetical protein